MSAATVAAAILAGGGGTRMGAGVVKGLLSVGGERIVDRQLAVLRPLFTDIVMVANEVAPWQALGLRVVPDRVPLSGPIAGLDAALAALPLGIDAVVCVAGDMPFLAPALVEHLRDVSPTAAALVPRVAGRAEPLLARYARSVAPVVVDQIANGRYAMVDLLARVGAAVAWIEEPELRALDPDLRSIANINTPADLAAYTPPKKA